MKVKSMSLKMNSKKKISGSRDVFIHVIDNTNLQEKKRKKKRLGKKRFGKKRHLLSSNQ